MRFSFRNIPFLFLIFFLIFLGSFSSFFGSFAYPLSFYLRSALSSAPSTTIGTTLSSFKPEHKARCRQPLISAKPSLSRLPTPTPFIRFPNPAVHEISREAIAALHRGRPYGPRVTQHPTISGCLGLRERVSSTFRETVLALTTAFPKTDRFENG